MRAMKDSGVPWLGMIPANWGISKTKYYYSTHKSIAGVRSVDYERLALTMRGVIKRSKTDDMGLQPDNFDTYQILRSGELVFKLIDLKNVSTSRVGLSPYTGLVSPAYIVLTPGFDVVPEFGQYYFLSLWQRKVFNHLGDEGVRSSLNTQDLLEIPYPILDISEQRCIADFLNSECSEIDALAADIQKEIDVLERYKRSVITEAVTKGLNPSVTMRNSGIEWVGQIPEHWRVMKNKYVMHKTKDICPFYNGEDILSLTMNGVIVRDLDAGGKMPKTFDGYQKIYAGNLLMCLFDIDVTPRCIGHIENDGLTSPAYSQFVLHDMAVSKYYFYYYLMVDFTKELLHLAKSLRHSLTEDQLGVINVPVPPVEEQIAIATYLDSKCSEIDSIIATKQKQLSVLDSYKKSLIYEYVTGKKEVP